ncbi:NADP-dependent oxidoreductase [Pediococcus argentinicus]|uniref:Oxidoreductase n=1 Tax=Pediococcus argentinicus TaxID=480391 RepID=A0A0R2NGF7_9LACO|nr:NADP-dependent oxidoreductase [Pediococcus argentinicus]KRO24910.1 oxidoreductase [Pediococcus argentinicus]NKZ22609.1 NADP-dependent oxidoreductase [Pediococcus argentinicus]GEP19732.1 dehydrogenase [Pediococcus argentinicus]
MKAITIDSLGEQSKFKLTEIDQPKPNDDEVLINIKAFSINPMDVAAKLGALNSPFPDNWSFPLVLGWDMSGIIVEVGSNITEYKVGDRVFGELRNDHAGNNGSYAEYCATDTSQLAKIPEKLSFAQAAALPIAGLTAYQAITESLDVQPEQHILIQGGAGGVGSIAVQVAKLRGAHVAATAGPAHIQMLQDLGVDQVINYHDVQPKDVLHDIDGVFDTVGDIEGGLATLRSDGKLITIAAQPTSEQLNGSQHVAFQFTHGTSKMLTELGGLIADGEVKQEVETLPFSAESVNNAQDRVGDRHVTGKLVITL